MSGRSSHCPGRGLGDQSPDDGPRNGEHPNGASNPPQHTGPGRWSDTPSNDDLNQTEQHAHPDGTAQRNHRDVKERADNEQPHHKDYELRLGLFGLSGGHARMLAASEPTYRQHAHRQERALLAACEGALLPRTSDDPSDPHHVVAHFADDRQVADRSHHSEGRLMYIFRHVRQLFEPKPIGSFYRADAYLLKTCLNEFCFEFFRGVAAPRPVPPH